MSKLKHKRQVLPEADPNTDQKVSLLLAQDGKEQDRAEITAEFHTRDLSAAP